MRLIFDKFDELGTIYRLFHWLIRNDISCPSAPRREPRRGNWTGAAHHFTLANAGASDLRGRVFVWSSVCRSETQVSPKYRPRVPMEQWKVLHKDRLPAYITWERYLQNRERIKQNRIGFDCRGDAAWHRAFGVAGLRHLRPADATSYHAHGKAQYDCKPRELTGHVARTGRRPWMIWSLSKFCALEPAAVELSIQASADVEQERKRLEKHWQQRRQRARYDAELAERRYQAVDPENRLVAATLEKRWEELSRRSSSRKNTTASSGKRR